MDSTSTPIGGIVKTDSVRQKLRSLKRSAKSRGLVFELSRDTVAELLSTQFCYYSGRELNSQNFSIDRIKSEKGYIEGNVVACCKEVNTLKSHLIEDPYTRLSSDELQKLLTSFQRFCQS